MTALDSGLRHFSAGRRSGHTTGSVALCYTSRGESSLYIYPDVTVVCGEARCEDDQQDTLLNPTLIVEVLSESTEAYDRGGKFAHYRKIPSLMEYVLIAQTKPYIEYYVRQPDNRRLLAEADSLSEAVHLPSIDCRLALAEVYDKVDIVVE